MLEIHHHAVRIDSQPHRAVQVKRRKLLALLGTAILIRPFIVLGQERPVPVIVLPVADAAEESKLVTLGVLAVDSLTARQFQRSFPESLRELGYVEGNNIRFEWRLDEGNGTHLAVMAAELARLKVDVIVTWLTPAAQAARQATRDIPIVMASAANPVETGLVESLARPGGNVTGVAGMGAERAAKTVEILQEMLPSVRRLAAIAFAPDPFSKPFLEQVRRAAAPRGTTVEPIIIRGPEEFEPAFDAMQKDRPDAVIVQATIATKRAAELALSYRIPAACTRREFVDQGGLVTYAVDDALAYDRAAVFVDKIIKGAKPADLPVEQPTKFELVINLKTAKALGITVPQSILARADEVIE